MRYTSKNFMPSLLFSTNNNTQTHRRLLVGVFILFLGLFSLGYWFFARPEVNNLPDTSSLESDTALVPPTAFTPEEVKKQYQETVTKTKLALVSAGNNLDSQKKILSDFFFSARVPSELRDAHLAALLQFKASDTVEKNQTIISELETAATQL